MHARIMPLSRIVVAVVRARCAAAARSETSGGDGGGCSRIRVIRTRLEHQERKFLHCVELVARRHGCV